MRRKKSTATLLDRDSVPGTSLKIDLIARYIWLAMLSLRYIRTSSTLECSACFGLVLLAPPHCLQTLFGFPFWLFTVLHVARVGAEVRACA